MASPIREVTPDPNDDIYITSPTTSSRIPQSFANSSPQNQHHSGQAALHPAPLVLDEGAPASRNLDSALAHAHSGGNHNNTNNLRNNNNNNNQPSRLAQRAQALAGVQFLHDTSQLNSSLNRLPLSPSHQNLRSPVGNAEVLNGNRSPGMHRPTSVPTHHSGGLDFNLSSAQNQQSALLPPAMKVRTAGGNNAQGADSVSSGSTGESQNYINNNNNKEGESGSMTPPRIQNTNTSFGSQGSVGGGGGAPGSLLTVFTGHETNTNNNNVNTPQRYTPRNEDIVIAGGDPGFSNLDKRSDLDSQKQGNAGRVLSDEGDKNDIKNNANFGGKQDQEKNSRGFRPSLRVVIAFACGLVILIVAVVTLAVTDTISTQTVRSLGLRLSSSYVTSATNKAEDYFNRPYNDLRSFTYLFKKPNVTELRDTPDMSVHQFCDGSRMLLESSNYTYPTVGLLGDSGSVFGVLPYFDIGMVGCGLRNNWNATLAGKSINDVAFYYMSNKTQVPAFAILPNSFDATPVDSRGATYSAMKSVAEKTPGVIYALSPASYLDGSNITSLNMPFFASVYNASMVYIGIAALSISSDKLNVFFLATDRTPNGHIVAIDRTFEIIASTVPNVATALTYRQAESLPVPNGCSSSASILTNPFPGIVCPYTLTTYKYRPCNVLAAQNDLKFLAPRRGQVMYQETDVDGEAYFMVSSSVPNPASLFALFIIFFMPTSDILSSIVSGRNLTIGITAAIFFVAIIAAVLLVFRLLKPLNQILYLMDLATKLELDTSLTDVQSNATSSSTDSRKANFSSIAEIYELQMAYKKMASAIDAFTKFFPREIIRDIAESGTLCKLGMRPGYASTSFLDIAGFTSISERVPNTDLAIALTIFYEQLSWCLQKTTGQLVAILGDGAFCCWNVPSVCLKHEMKAALFALMMSRETAKEPLAGAFDDMGEKLFLRIGLSSGEVAHGNCGSSQRMSWSVYSNSVNFSARLESINKQFGTRVMVSDSIAMKVQNLILLRFIMPVQVVGKEEVTTIYEPVGLLPDIVLDAVAPKHEELHSLQSMSRMENSLSYSLANPSKYAASLSGQDSSMPHVSRRKNANVTAREVLAEMLSWEDASLKVSQLELDFVHAYNQCSQSFAEGNPSLCLQQLAEVRRSFPMFFYDDFGAALKRAIQEQKELAERTHTASSGSSMGSNNNNTNNSTVKFYHPADRCESCLIQAEMSAQKLETLCVSIQARMLKQQQMNTASGSTGIQEYQEPVGLHDFVFRADHK